jgi:hypothetical protein
MTHQVHVVIGSRFINDGALIHFNSALAEVLE